MKRRMEYVGKREAKKILTRGLQRDPIEKKKTCWGRRIEWMVVTCPLYPQHCVLLLCRLARKNPPRVFFFFLSTFPQNFVFLIICLPLHSAFSRFPWLKDRVSCVLGSNSNIDWNQPSVTEVSRWKKKVLDCVIHRAAVGWKNNNNRRRDRGTNKKKKKTLSV